MSSRCFAAVVLLGLAFLGCRAPTHERERPAGTLRLYDIERAAGPAASEILDAAQATLRDTAAALDLRGVTIDISFDARRAIPDFGIGGYTPSAERVLVWIDPVAEAPDLLTHRLPWIVAHELHHAKRWQAPGYGDELLEALVSEGLADHFARELVGPPVPYWTHVLEPEELERVRPRADSALDGSYAHDDWFLGYGNLPAQTGYHLGYALVARHLADHPGETAASLVARDADAFRASWLAGATAP